MTAPFRWWLLTVLALAAAAGVVLWAAAGIPDGWGLVVVPPLTVCLGAMVLTAWPTMIGAAARLGLSGPRLAPARFEPGSRTAILVPVHNEDPVAVFAAIRAMRTQLDAARIPGTEIFVLSDTRDPDIAAGEEAEYAALSPIGTPVTYRRRQRNTGRKAGNIAEFCTRWGGAFDYMLVLDADSVMGAGAIRRLIGLMDANPRAGLIQTVPYAVNRETLHARLAQFAMRFNTPLWAEGAAVWHGADANYWGHNAIIRIAPFQRHATLPVLPGRAPLGGEILCHDVVEAAFLRAAGWDTWLVPDIADSFEELPPNLADDAARERRWCQGNLQHTRLLSWRGLRGPGRLHLGSGVLYYAASPCWVALALLLTAMPADIALATVHALLGPVMAVFALPKLCAIAANLLDARRAGAFGGRARATASLLAEQAIGVLTTPSAMLSSTRFVLGTLAGNVVRWDAQARDDRGLGWAEAWSRFGWQAAIGAVWGAALLLHAPALLPWASTLLAGLLLAAPVAVLTSRLDLGRAARRLGLFLTTDEIHPSPVLRAYRASTATPVPALAEDVPLADALPAIPVV